ncbi:MAG: malectin domain-containing carbohydrate-binding protein [Terracidiphilus sp.]
MALSAQPLTTDTANTAKHSSQFVPKSSPHPLCNGYVLIKGLFSNCFIGEVTDLKVVSRLQPAHLLGSMSCKGGIFTVSSQTQSSGVAEEIQAALASQTFSEAPLLARLLEYLCNNHLNENKRTLNEYRIGVEALGRPADFDPAKNSSVRVEMHRLRQRLRKYYETEGADHAFRITLIEGKYDPQFLRREDLPADSLSQPAEPSVTGGAHHGNATGQLPPIALGNSAGQLRRGRFSYFSLEVVGLAASVVVVLLIILWIVIETRSRVKETHDSVQVPPSVLDNLPAAPALDGSAPALDGSVRILAGYSKKDYLDREGRVWRGDSNFTGGEAIELKLPYIQGTADPTIYRTARVGEFRYDIPIRSGEYEMRLHFVETTFGPGTFTGRGESSRVFSVILNGKPILTNFDILSDAGGNFRAFVRVFKNISPGNDGMIHLAFQRIFDQPMINAIELVPEFGGRLNPVRVVMQDNSYVDHAGGLWSPDRYAIGGVLAAHQNPAATTTDPHLFDGERFGHFNYQIPVAPGRYTVTLYFTESYIGAMAPGQDNGGRIFDVYANGVALLRNFNIFAKAGGPNKPVVETFHSIEPNAAGLIDLSFVPVKNYACLDAIKVTDESP